MPLQNRVDPFGVIHADPARGLFMGNRGGRIHGPATRTLMRRRWASKAWIVCLCDFRGRQRQVMAPNSYTELFFLDEATALASGHRPCFECQHARAKEFSARFAEGNGLPAQKAGNIDDRLHAERLATGSTAPAVDPEAFATLPDGTMVAVGPRPFLRAGGRWHPWSFSGYGPPIKRLPGGARIVTPPSTVGALTAGYWPVLHASALVPAT